MRIAVNGFGRIGRLVTRIVLTQMPELQIAAINDPAPVETQAYLLQYDSNYGGFPWPVRSRVGANGGSDRLLVGGAEIYVGHTRSPDEMRWGDLGVDLVVDATGRLRKRVDLEKHLAAGAQRVLVSAPSSGADVTLVYGVNETSFDPAHHRVVSAASCTTNAAAAILETVDRAWTVDQAFVTTVHAYTNSQALVDHGALDLRDGRAAGTNIVPSATGAATALEQLFPHLRGRVDGVAYRVPTASVSLLDLALIVADPPALVDLVDLLRRERDNPARRGTLAVADDPLVSSDARRNPASAVVSVPDLRVRRRAIRVSAWYDNEWGYSARLADLARYLLLRSARRDDGWTARLALGSAPLGVR